MVKRWGWRSKFEQRIDVLKVVAKYSGQRGKRRLLAIVGSNWSGSCGYDAVNKLINFDLIRCEKKNNFGGNPTQYLFINPKGKWVLRLWREFQEAFGFKASSIVGDLLPSQKKELCSSTCILEDSAVESLVSLRGDELFYILSHAKPEARERLRYVRLGAVKFFLKKIRKEAH